MRPVRDRDAAKDAERKRTLERLLDEVKVHLEGELTKKERILANSKKSCIIYELAKLNKTQVDQT